MDGPITALRLFRATNHERQDKKHRLGSTHEGEAESIRENQSELSSHDLNCLAGVGLLVTCAVEAAFIYLYVLKVRIAAPAPS